MHLSNIVSTGCLRPSADAKAGEVSAWRAITSVLCVAAACIGLAPVDSQAALTLAAPLRTVSSVNNKGSSHFDQAVGFEDMNSSVRVDWEEYWGPPANTLGSYYSTANQTSTVSASGIHANGSASGTGSFEFWGDDALEQHSTSYFEIDFTIDAPSTVSLTGQLRLFVDTGGTNYDMPEVWVILSGRDGPLFSEHLDYRSDGMTKLIDETFESLEAGDYNLVAYAETDGNYFPEGIGGFGYASYDVVLVTTAVPEPAPLGLAAFSVLLALMRRSRTA